MADTAPPPAGRRFGLNRNTVVLMAVILVVGTGEELWLRFLPAYLEALGGGVWVVAAYGAIFNLLDAVYQYPGGWAADRLVAGARSSSLPWPPQPGTLFTS